LIFSHLLSIILSKYQNITIMEPVTAGLGIASLAGQVFGGLYGGNQMTAAENLLKKQLEENEAFYNLNVKRDFLDTNVAKGMFERLRKDLEEAGKTIESKAAVTGATPEAEIAEKTKLQEKHGEAVSNLAEGATQYQQGQEAMYRGEKGRLTQQQIDLAQQRAEQGATVASHAGNLMSAAGALEGFGEVGNQPPILSPENLEKWKDIPPYRGVLLGQS
jgi:hypothetical protein